MPFFFRIPLENHFDMYKWVKENGEGNYFGKKYIILCGSFYPFILLGVGEFVDETENTLDNHLTLNPGTFTEDIEYEKMTDLNLDPDSFYNYVKQVNDGQMNTEQAARLYGLLLLYIGKTDISLEN